MKILFDYKIFYQQKVGGISNYFYNLGKQLIKLNQDILYSIPLHKNKYCKLDGRISLDLGPFVDAIEDVSGIKAEIMGKPEKKI